MTLAEIDAIRDVAADTANARCLAEGWDAETRMLMIAAVRRYAVSFEEEMKATFETCPTCGHVLDMPRAR